MPFLWSVKNFLKNLVLSPISVAAWIGDQFYVLRCRFGIHEGPVRQISDGHYCRHCVRCGKTEWID